MHDRGVDQCGIVAFLKDREAPGKTRDQLCTMNINAHEARLSRLDLSAPGVDATIRRKAGQFPLSGAGPLPACDTR